MTTKNAALTLNIEDKSSDYLLELLLNLDVDIDKDDLLAFGYFLSNQHKHLYMVIRKTTINLIYK